MTEDVTPVAEDATDATGDTRDPAEDATDPTEDTTDATDEAIDPTGDATGATGDARTTDDDVRVATLLPSATEIVYALGVEPVATSHECDYPPEAVDLPSVVESRIDDDAPSADIDEQVRAAAADGPIYAIDREALTAADPDVVVAQGVCEVCAVDTAVVADAVADLGLDCEVVTTDAHGLDDVLNDVRRVGDAIGREKRAAELVAELQARIERVAETAGEAPFRPDVAVLDWMDPVMVAGHWVPELVETAGGHYGLAAPGDDSKPQAWDDVRKYDPDIVVAGPCGFELERTLEDVEDLTDRDGWHELRAVRMNRAYAMDGHHLLNRPGPRIVDTLEALAGLVQPDLFEQPEEWMVRSITGTRS